MYIYVFSHANFWTRKKIQFPPYLIWPFTSLGGPYSNSKKSYNSIMSIAQYSLKVKPPILNPNALVIEINFSIRRSVKAP